MWEVEFEKAKELYYDEKYDQCIIQCHRLLNNTKDKNCDNNQIFFINFMLSVSYQILNLEGVTQNTALALKYINTASKYAINAMDKMRVEWQLGWCYEEIDRKLSINYYRKALFICVDSINNEEYVHLLRSDLARLNDNEQGILEAIEDYKSLSNNTHYINQLYEYLCKYYIEHDEYDKAQITLHNITDVDLLNKLQDKMCIQQEVVNAF
jgi:hypothetical protein